jgi:FAD dependent oxidoreductase
MPETQVVLRSAFLRPIAALFFIAFSLHAAAAPALAAPVAPIGGPTGGPAPTSADLIVYGGTASGIMTAFTAAHQGLRVILLEPGAHLGGMVTGGLSATDIGNSGVIGGYVRDFYMRAASYYGLDNLNHSANWRSEPHVDLEIFQGMLAQAHVRVRLHERLRERNGVQRQGTHILSITTADGRRWRAAVFADCTYEGDLMAQAGVHYTVGREPSSQYGESLAGVRAHTPKHQFRWYVSAYDEHHRLLPEISPGPLAEPGSGDKNEQAYNFRMILTNDPADRLPFPRPAGYNRADFALLARYLSSFPRHQGRVANLHDVTNPVPIPNHKADFNNNGPFSTDYIGHSRKYPDGTYAQRAVIWRQHLLYTQSFMYFLSHDSSVPASLRAEVNTWGLPKDEFADTAHWPNQLYIREGRRMIGAYVMRQSDLQTDLTKPDSIGMGSYNSDSHNEQRLAMPDGAVQNEGDVEVGVKPYQIPYRVITPQRAQATNLLVPVCLSASHAAYSSVRMEPQYMIIGQAAGDAAVLAVQGKLAVQDVPIKRLQQMLRLQRAILSSDEEFPAAGK